MKPMNRAQGMALIQEAKSLGVYSASDIELMAGWLATDTGLHDLRATIANARKLIELGLM